MKLLRQTKVRWLIIMGMASIMTLGSMTIPRDNPIMFAGDNVVPYVFQIAKIDMSDAPMSEDNATATDVKPTGIAGGLCTGLTCVDEQGRECFNVLGSDYTVIERGWPVPVQQTWNMGSCVPATSWIYPVAFLANAVFYGILIFIISIGFNRLHGERHGWNAIRWLRSGGTAKQRVLVSILVGFVAATMTSWLFNVTVPFEPIIFGQDSVATVNMVPVTVNDTVLGNLSDWCYGLSMSMQDPQAHGGWPLAHMSYYYCSEEIAAFYPLVYLGNVLIYASATGCLLTLCAAAIKLSNKKKTTHPDAAGV